MTPGARSWARLLLVSLGVLAASVVGAEATETVGRILETADRAARARWTAVTADDALANPLVTWSLWGRGDGLGSQPLATGGLRISTPWVSVEAGGWQNRAPQAPGGSLAVAIPLAGGSGGYSVWAGARDLAVQEARLEAVNEFRRSVTRDLEALGRAIAVWIERRNLEQSERELRGQLEEMAQFPDRFSDREQERLRSEASRLALGAAVAAADLTDPSLVAAVLSGAPTQASDPVRPVADLFRGNAWVLERQVQARRRDLAAAVRRSAALPAFSVTLGVQQASWGGTSPALGAEVRASGGWGSPSPEVVEYPEVRDVAHPPKAWIDAKVLLAEHDLTRARARLALAERDRARAPEAWEDLREARSLVEAQAAVLNAWLALVSVLVDQALEPGEG